MLKLYSLLIAAVAMPLTVSAADEATTPSQQFKSHVARSIERSETQAINKAPGLTIDDAIHTAPEGKVTQLSRSGEAYYSTWSGYKMGSFTGLASEIVECENGDFYLKNPISLLTTNLYIKGRKEGNKLVFDLPQVAYLEPYYGNIYPYKLTNMVYCEADKDFYPVDSEIAKQLNLPEVENTFVIDILEDGSYNYSAPDGGNVFAGLVDVESDKWSGYGEIESTWETMDVEKVTVPTDLKIAETIVTNKSTEPHYANIGFNGNDVYVQGLFSAMPKAWMKGTRNGDAITFASSQYLGVEPVNNAHVFFVAATYNTSKDPQSEKDITEIKYAEDITFSYDKDNDCYKALDGQTATLSGYADRVAYLEYLREPEMMMIPADMSYNPAKPEILLYDYSAEWGDLKLNFKLPAQNKQGIPLDKRNIYFSFFVDGEVFTFTPEEYSSFKEPQSLFPYDIFVNDLMLLPGENMYEAWFYFGEKPIGIQSYYYKDGKKIGESEIAVAQSSGIEDVTADGNKTVHATEYYTVTGQRIDKPSTGIFIKVIRYNDGSIKTSKTTVK